MCFNRSGVVFSRVQMRLYKPPGIPLLCTEAALLPTVLKGVYSVFCIETRKREVIVYMAIWVKPFCTPLGERIQLVLLVHAA